MAKSTVPGSVWELLPKAGPPSPLLQAAKAAMQAAAKARRRMARRRGACRVSGFTVLKLPETWSLAARLSQSRLTNEIYQLTAQVIQLSVDFWNVAGGRRRCPETFR